LKKLLIVIGSMNCGGAEVQTLELANGLVDLDYAVDIVVLDHKIDLIDRARPEISFHIMNKRTYLDPAVLRKLRLLMGDKKPDVTLCVDLYPVLYVRLALCGTNGSYPVAAVLHSTTPLSLKDQIQRLYLVRMARSLDQLIFVSKNQMEYWSKGWKLNQDNAAVIHNGIDIERFAGYLRNVEAIREVKEKYGLGDQEIVIGHCSDFRHEKRLKDLIQVYADLKERGYPVKLLLIGDGYMRRSLEEQINLLGLKNDVSITGLVSDVRPYLAAVDIFALTSDSSETLSLAAIESLAMKKPVVISDIGGASEIVADGINGYLYPACDLEALAEKLESILQGEKWVAMGEAGYLRACQYFHKRLMIQSYDFLFQDLQKS